MPPRMPRNKTHPTPHPKASATSSSSSSSSATFDQHNQSHGNSNNTKNHTNFDKNTHSNSTTNEESQQNEDPSLAYLVANGRDDILLFWCWDCDMEEKRAILDVDFQEVIDALEYSGMHLQMDNVQWKNEFTNRLKSLLSQTSLIQPIREVFVDAIHSNGRIEAARIPTTGDGKPDPVIIALFMVMENHLVRLFDRRTSMLRLAAFGLFWWFWVNEWTRWLRYPLLIVLAIFSMILWISTGGPSQQFPPVQPNFVKRTQLFVHRLLIPFEVSLGGMNSTNMLPSTLDAVLCACLTLELAQWLSFWQFFIISLISAFPLIVSIIQLEIGTRYSADTKGLQFAREVSLFISKCMLLYFAWYSYITTTFVLVFFLPTATAFAITSALVAIVLCSSVGSSIRTQYLKLDQRPLISWSMFVTSIIVFYFTRSSYLYLLLNILFAVLCTPTVIDNVILVACGALSDYIVSQGVTQLLFAIVQILAVLCITLVVSVISYLGKWRIMQLFAKLIIVISLAAFMLLLLIAMQVHSYLVRFSFYSHIFRYGHAIWSKLETYGRQVIVWFTTRYG